MGRLNVNNFCPDQKSISFESRRYRTLISPTSLRINCACLAYCANRSQLKCQASMSEETRMSLSAWLATIKNELARSSANSLLTMVGQTNSGEKARTGGNCGSRRTLCQANAAASKASHENPCSVTMETGNL